MFYALFGIIDMILQLLLWIIIIQVILSWLVAFNVINTSSQGLRAFVGALECDAPFLKVVGELPRELNGTLYRNGPNPQFPPRGAYHWFDGDGMVHAVYFRDGRASYIRRWVRTRALRSTSPNAACTSSATSSTRRR